MAGENIWFSGEVTANDPQSVTQFIAQGNVYADRRLDLRGTMQVGESVHIKGDSAITGTIYAGEDVWLKAKVDLRYASWANLKGAIDDPTTGHTIELNEPLENQPLIGIIDAEFNITNPDIDPTNIILGYDWVDQDNDPTTEDETANEHGTPILGIIGAVRNNGIGINGVNDDAPIWLGRAIGSGNWANSLNEFVDAAQAFAQPNAVVNLSFDLVQTEADGDTSTRYQLTPDERLALENARQNNVLIVAASGNDGSTMSALGQASQEFDNILTVGSVDENGDREAYSSYGNGLDVVAFGGSLDNPVISTVGDGADLKALLGETDRPDDEMAVQAQAIFTEAFGDLTQLGNIDDTEFDSLSDEERQLYEEATQEIDQILSDYLTSATEKLALEYADGYYSSQVEALEQFLEAVDEDFAENLIKTQELFEQAGLSLDLFSNQEQPDQPLVIPFDEGIGTIAGTSAATAKVTGAVSQIWAANPELNYSQVKDIVKQTAIDLNTPGWDEETGAGLVNLEAAVELAQNTLPEPYEPLPLAAPLTWSGEDELFPGERAVNIAVPDFSGQILNVGYVDQVGFLRIRSGPGQQFDEIGKKEPGDFVTFDAYTNEGSFVYDPYMPNEGSSRWYQLADTSYWMSGLYIDNSPEQAAQERQRQEEIRQAEEALREAEEAAQRAEEEARQAEEELRKIEEQQRQKQEEIQKIINDVTQKFGDLGLLLGSYISNGVRVYEFVKGKLYLQPDNRYSFYNRITENTSVGEFFSEISTNVAKPAFKFINQKFVLKGVKESVDDFLIYGISSGSGKNGFKLPRLNSVRYVRAVRGANAIGIGLDIAWSIGEIAIETDPEKKRELLVKRTFQTGGAAIGGAIGAVAGGFLGGFAGTATVPIPIIGTVSVAALAGIAGAVIGSGIGSMIGGAIGDAVNNNWDSVPAPISDTVENLAQAISIEPIQNLVNQAQEKAQQAQEKADELAQQAKAAYRAAQVGVQKAQDAYQTFRQIRGLKSCSSNPYSYLVHMN